MNPQRRAAAHALGIKKWSDAGVSAAQLVGEIEGPGSSDDDPEWPECPESVRSECPEPTDVQTSHAVYRVCDRAGLEARSWDVLRHSHAARFGVNPWQLIEWMGHKRIDETMGYVHIAQRHRAIPPELVAAGMKEIDPTARIVAMLGAGHKLGKSEMPVPTSQTTSAS